MTTSIPDGFGPVFLDWFRLQTEAYWAKLPDETPEEILAGYLRERATGCTWQRATKWLGGLSNEQIDALETQWNLRFPPDYRLFLQRLHSVDKPILCTGYFSIGEVPEPGGDHVAAALDEDAGQYMALDESPSFYNWIDGQDSIQGALEGIVHGLIFSATWEAEPNKVQEIEQNIRSGVAGAPRLIPIIEHRFLLAEPCHAGNPVLSIHQTDIVVCAANLRDFLLGSFIDPMTLSPHDRDKVKKIRPQAAHWTDSGSIPYWLEP
jgi:hypothetical protein